jgi:S1 RNA binding domain protein
LAIEVGSILEGRVTGVKSFGAFVALPEGKTGLVHISEVSNSYIEDLNAVLKEGQTVNVKVLSIAPDGKIALSIKRLLPPEPGRTGAPRTGAPRGQGPHGGGARGAGRRGPHSDAPRVWQPRQSAAPDSMSFEDMMNHFKSQSEEKMAELDRETSNRRGGGYAPRGHKR